MTLRYRSRLERRIVRRAGEAVCDHDLIASGDRILVAVSGGKDSLGLLHALHLLRRRAPVRFELVACTIDRGYGEPHPRWLEQHVRELGHRFVLVHAPIRELLEHKLEAGTSPCALCSRIRRGALYTRAVQLQCTKVALGHHLDDLIETLLLNLFYSGQLRSMPPRLQSEDGLNTVIRPLCYIPEAWLARYAAQRGFPAVSCQEATCGRPDVQRREMKTLVQRLAERHPGLRFQALRALANVRPEYLLDRDLVRRLDR